MKKLFILAIALFLLGNLQAQIKKTIVAFDLLNYKSTLDTDIETALRSYCMEKLNALSCINVPNAEAREKLAKDSGTFMANWAVNQRTAAQTAGWMGAGGYITATIMDEEGKTRISMIFHENGKEMNVWYETVANDLAVLKTTLDGHIAKICPLAGN